MLYGLHFRFRALLLIHVSNNEDIRHLSMIVYNVGALYIPSSIIVLQEKYSRAVGECSLRVKQLDQW